MSEPELTGKRWVAIGPSGAVGSVHSVEGGYTFRLIGEDAFRGTYESLDAAKNALTAAQLPGAERPEFREH